MATRKIDNGPRAVPVFLVDPSTESDLPTISTASGPGSTLAVTIVSGQSLSPAIDLGNFRLGMVCSPAAIDSASKITFQVAQTLGGTYRDLYKDDGTEYSLTAGVSRSMVPDLTVFASARFIKIRQGTSGSPTVTAADRTYDLGLIA